MNRCEAAAVAILCTVLAASPVAADCPDRDCPGPQPAQQPAVEVSCDVLEVWATHGKSGADPAIGATLAKRLGATLKQNEFKLKSSNKAALTAKKPHAVKLAKGSATITLVETVNKSQIRMTVDFTAAKGNQKQTVLVAAGDYVIVSVNQSSAANAEAHVLAVGSCK